VLNLLLVLNTDPLCVDLSTILDAMIGHSGAKYACKSCGKQIADRRDMRRHCETHLDMTHACELCHKVCKTRDALRQHYSAYHKS